MKRIHLPIVILGALISFITVTNDYADAQSTVVPNAFANVDANGVSEFLTGDQRDTSVRYQQVFSSSQFGDSGLIKEIAFRPDAVQGIAFSGTLNNVRIALSTTTKAPDGLSSTFADNIGLNELVVYSGNLSLTSNDVAGPGNTRAFDIRIPLTVPFPYNPAVGNLLLDFQRDASLLNPAGISFDAHAQTGDSISRVLGSRSSSTAFSNGVDSTGLVTRFTFVPEPSSILLLGLVSLVALSSRRRSTTRN